MPTPDPDLLATREAYLGRVQGLVIEQDWLTPEDFDAVWRLVDHGEPAEGLCELAWIIASTQQRVPAQVVADIRRWTEGLVDPEDLPPDLDTFAH